MVPMKERTIRILRLIICTLHQPIRFIYIYIVIISTNDVFLRYQSKKILYHKNNIFPVEIPSDLKIFTRNRESCTCHDFNSYLFSSLKAEQSWLFPLIFMDEQLQVKVSASYCYCRIIIVVPCE